MAAVLIAIIVAALASVIWRYLPSRSENTQTAAQPMFECIECHYQFPAEVTLDNPDLAELKVAVHDCLQCKAKGSAYKMTLCPNPKCNKHYLSEATKKLAAAARKGQLEQFKGTESPDVDPDSICPYCNMSIRQWQLEQYRKKKGL